MSLKKKMRKVEYWQKPDIDCPRLKCGHPLPCPRHVVRVLLVIDQLKQPKIWENP
jgi:hypothetical protein